MGRKWKIHKRIPKAIDKRLEDYPSIVRQLLFNRGITKRKEVREYLDPKKVVFYNPRKIYDIKKAAQIILDCIKSKRKIFIHGDFDVDGICSTAILWDFLYRQLKADVLPYVPSRFDEGYGMSDESLSNIKDQGGEVVITVDCGIKDHDLVKKWRKKGLEFVITDHHELEKKNGKVILPDEALAVVHPRHPKGDYPFGEISGATVVWNLVNIIVELGNIDFDIDNYLDLVTLSVICDVMPLIKENRAIVKRGLERLKNTKRIGLRRLIFDAGIEPSDINTYHIGFIIGPRLNAAGRLDHAIDAVKLLVTMSYSKAREISDKLNRLNKERQRIQEDIFKSAIKQIEESGMERKLYFVWGDDWAEGVIGIVAGRISEIYNRPVLIATNKKGKFTGSARSSNKYNIIEAISSQSKLLDRFGGHPQAAGFTVKSEVIEQFRDNLLEIADRDLSDKDIKKEYTADMGVNLDDIDWDTLKWIDRFAPFGFGNEKPRFVLKNIRLSNVVFVGSEGKHLKFGIKNNSNTFLSGIGFGLGDEFKNITSGDKVDILFSLEVNVWNGQEKLQLNVKDIRPRSTVGSIISNGTSLF